MKSGKWRERISVAGRASHATRARSRPPWLARHIFILASALIAFKAAATPVLLSVKNHSGANSSLQVTFKPKNNPFVIGSEIFAGSEIVTNLTDGQVVVELVPDDYSVQFGGVPKSFIISVFETNVVLRAETLSTNLATYVYTNLMGQISSRVFAGSGVTISTNDFGTALESITLSVPGGGVSVAAGSNASAVTNSGLVTISADVSHQEVRDATNGLGSAAFHPASDFQSALGFTAVPTTRTISTTSPLTGGGDLSTDRTFAIGDAAADGTTKGAATFAAADFNAAAGLVSIDYANGQKASGAQPGFLLAADYNTFNGKQAAGNYITALTGDMTASGPGSVAATLKNTGTAGTYRSVTFDAQGRETSGSNPTTFSGYAISDTSANLATAITDETGSGLLVFGTSPTIVTPTIASFANANHNHQNSAGGGTLDGAAIATGTISGARLTGITNIYEFCLSDETTAISSTGTKVTWRAPHAMTLKDCRASVTTVSSSGLPTVNILESGITIFSTKLTIDASEKTSTTAATPFAFSDTSIADDAEITFTVDVTGTGATGLKVKLYYTR